MTIKQLAGRASFLLVKLVLVLARIIPAKCSYALCSFTACAGSLLPWKRKRIALGNLKIVFPEKTEKERLQIFRESLRNMFKNYFEMAFIINGKYSAEKILEVAGASGLDQLDKLVNEDQGALLYSGHFGNFPLMMLWLAIKGYPVATIYKEAEHFPENFFGNIMKKFNLTPLKYESETSVTVAIIRALKKKKIVLIQNDQSHPFGIYVNFFNKWVPSPAGPALLAKRAGVPVVPAYVIRDRSNRHHISVLPEIALQQEDDLDKFMAINTQIMIDWIAGILVEHPDEWLWLHNRWKRARPNP
jgi:KDO2-lipid IV(A) lauroyltransferase